MSTPTTYTSILAYDIKDGGYLFALNLSEGLGKDSVAAYEADPKVDVHAVRQHSKRMAFTNRSDAVQWFLYAEEFLYAEDTSPVPEDEWEIVPDEAGSAIIRHNGAVIGRIVHRNTRIDTDLADGPREARRYHTEAVDNREGWQEASYSTSIASSSGRVQAPGPDRSGVAFAYVEGEN